MPFFLAPSLLFLSHVSSFPCFSDEVMSQLKTLETQLNEQFQAAEESKKKLYGQIRFSRLSSLFLLTLSSPSFSDRSQVQLDRAMWIADTTLKNFAQDLRPQVCLVSSLLSPLLSYLSPVLCLVYLNL
jgi:hypothetical protein